MRWTMFRKETRGGDVRMWVGLGDIMLWKVQVSEGEEIMNHYGWCVCVSCEWIWLIRIHCH